jgi:hypothetical protein
LNRRIEAARKRWRNGSRDAAAQSPLYATPKQRGLLMASAERLLRRDDRVEDRTLTRYLDPDLFIFDQQRSALGV